MMKSWRNKNPQLNFDESINNANDINPFLKKSENLHKTPNQLPLLVNPAMKQESFSLSMYILLTLTLVVIILFLNCYRKRRNPIRPRRKYFLFNKLGLYA